MSTATKGDYYKNLSVTEIRRDGGTQISRDGIDEDTVEKYAGEMREGLWSWHQGNAVVVFYDEHGRYWLSDGFQRIEAAQRAFSAIAEVYARVVPGSRRAAILYAAGANADHGLSRTRDGVRRAIKTLLKDEEWGRWSDAEIARQVHCSDKTVGKVRAELIASSEIPRIEERTVSRNGKTYQQAAPPASQVEISAQDISAEFPGWRWNHRGVDWQMQAPDGWHTGWYYKPERAVAEARRRMLSMPSMPKDEPLARPAGAPSVEEYEAAVTTLVRDGYVLSCEARADRQRGCPPYWLTGHGAPRRMEFWSEVQAKIVALAAEKSDYLTKIRAASYIPGLNSLRLDIAADKSVPDDVMQVLNAQIDAQIARLRAQTVTAVCFDCGATDDVILVNGAAGHLCHSCATKRNPNLVTSAIKISTEKGVIEVIPIQRTADIALHRSTRPGLVAITHIGTGLAIHTVGDQAQAEAAFARLAQLDWSDMHGEMASFRLAEKIVVILGQELTPGRDQQRRDDLMRRAEAIGCAIFGARNNYCLVRGGAAVASCSGELDTLDQLIGGLERAAEIEATREQELIARAVACGWSVTSHGGGWRLSKDDVPRGGIKSLEELEVMVKGWEGSIPVAEEPEQVVVAEEPEQVVVAEEPEQPEQVAPPAAPAERPVLIQHVESIIAAMIERATPEELRVLHCLHYGESFFADFDSDNALTIADDLWISVREWLQDMSVDNLAWITTGDVPPCD